MIIDINLLTISADGTKLLLDASIDKNKYPDAKIQEIIIDTQDTFIEGRPSQNSYHLTIEDSDNINMEITVNTEFNNTAYLPTISKNMFFVWIKWNQKLPVKYEVCTPCNEKSEYILAGVVFNDCPLKEKLMPYIKQVSTNCCNIPKDFINHYLRYKALELAVCLGHYSEAIYLYKAFVINQHFDSPVTTCACHG